jgi:hypothetical protein
MLIPRQIIWYLVGVLFVGCLSYQLGRAHVYRPPVVIRGVFEFETIRETEKVIETEKIRWKTVKAPDGTVTQEVEKDVQTQKEVVYIETKETEFVESLPAAIPPRNYSMGFGMTSEKEYYGELGYRVFDNIYGEIQMSPKEISLGLRIDF